MFILCIALNVCLILSPKLWRLAMAIQMVPCATSPSLLRVKPTPPVPPKAVLTTCHGVPPQLTTAETRNTASAQVNVSLTNYFAREIVSQRLARWGYLLYGNADWLRPLILVPNSHPDSSVHIWRKRQWSRVCLPLHLFGRGIWQLHHRGPQWWLPLVCHHRKLWQWQEIRILPQSWWVTRT